MTAWSLPSWRVAQDLLSNTADPADLVQCQLIVVCSFKETIHPTDSSRQSDCNAHTHTHIDTSRHKLNTKTHTGRFSLRPGDHRKPHQSSCHKLAHCVPEDNLSTQHATATCQLKMQTCQHVSSVGMMSKRGACTSEKCLETTWSIPSGHENFERREANKLKKNQRKHDPIEGLPSFSFPLLFSNKLTCSATRMTWMSRVPCNRLNHSQEPMS